MNNEATTIYTTYDVTEAGAIQSELEANGIRTFLADENIVGAHAFLANAVGGVKVQVAAGDEARAREILLERQQPRTPSTNPRIDTGWGVCPQCGGVNLMPFREALGWKGVLLLFGLLVVRPQSKLRCNSCEYEWRRR